MVRLIPEQVRKAQIAGSFTPGYRPPATGPDALLEREQLFVFPDKVLLIGTGGGAYIELDLDRSGPGTPGPAPQRYVHLQSAEATQWFINHNLGYRPVISVITLGGALLIAAVEHLSNNLARVDLDDPMTGQAICV